MGYYADSIDVDFTIAPDKVAGALAALNEEMGVAAPGADDGFRGVRFGAVYSDLADAVEDLTSFKECYSDDDGFNLGYHNDKYLSRTDDVLKILARFAVEGSYVRFNGEDYTLFGYRVVDGELRNESATVKWTVDA